MARDRPRGGPSAILVLLGIVWIASLLPSCVVQAMRADHLGKLRQDTVDMFYHGYDNYMQHAFPEDEVDTHSFHARQAVTSKSTDKRMNKSINSSYLLTLAFWVMLPSYDH